MSAIPDIHNGFARADLLEKFREMILRGEGELFFLEKKEIVRL